jgi:glucokinase
MNTCIIAVDIGATNLRAACLENDGVIVSRSRGNTPHDGGAEAIVNAAVEMIRRVTPAKTDVRGICIGVPAPVDPETGYIDEASNLPALEGVSLLPLFVAHFSTPVAIRNDAALATMGEHRYGAGRGVQNMAYVTISTGIGGGVIVGGRLMSGAGNYAGEIGELLMPSMSGDPFMPANLESLASGSAIAAAATRALNDGEESILRELAPNPAAVTSRIVADAARRGDRLALRILRTAATYIGFGIVDVVHLLNPERVVLGGGVMGSADLVMPVIRETVARFAMESSQRNLTIIEGTLGDDAGLLGGAAFYATRDS